MKRIVTVLITAVLLVVCASCSSEDGGTPERDTSQVIIAISSEPETLDPCKGWGHGFTPLVQSTLVEYRQDMSIANDLATDYTLSDDRLTWTFRIRDDAYFTDGEQLTAADVAFTFNTAKDEQTTLDLSYLESAVAVDEFTVEFRLTRAHSTFINTVASVGIVPEHAYSEDYGTNPIGSAAYKFVQWNPGEQIILEANPDYYGDVPAIERVVLVFMDADAALAAVRAGQVDVALTSATLADQEIEGYRLVAVTSMDNRGLTLPVNKDEGETTPDGYPIGNDVTGCIEIRKALAYGIDRERVAADALNGYGDPAYSENDGMLWHNPETEIATDVEYAKSLLAEAGWADTDGDGIVEKDGLKAEFTCLYPSGDTVRQPVAMAAAEQARELGISIVVEGTSWDDIDRRMFSSAVLMGWGSTDPYTTYCLYHSSYALRDDYYNPENYRSSITDDYLESALAAATQEEANEYWKLAQWDGENGPSMCGDCPWVWLVNVQHLYYVADGLDIGEQMLHPHGADWPLIQNLREWSWSES